MSAVLTELPPFVAYGIEARRVMPGYVEATAAIDRVRRQMHQSAVLPPRYPDVAVLAEAAVTGEPVPADLGDQVLAADHAKAVQDARRAWTQRVIDHLQAELQQISISQLDAGLRFLDTELQTILAAAAAALDVAGTLSTADQALRAPDDQREAFLQIDELTRRLVLLRDAQRDLMISTLDYMSDGAGNTDGLLRYAGTVANLAEVLPDWRQAQKNGGRAPVLLQGNTDPDDPRLRLTPWRPQGDPLVPVVDREHLVWLVESPAIPWVPTVAEARLVTDRLLTPTIPPRTNQEKADAARAERKFDELLAMHARAWSFSEHAGYRPDGYPIH